MEVVVDLQDLLKLAGIAAPQQSEPVIIPVPDQMEPEAEPVSSCGCGGMHEETDHTEDAGTEFKNATDRFHGRKDVVVSSDDFDEYSYQNQAKAKQADPNAFAQYGDNPLKESDMHKRYQEFCEADWSVGLDLFKKAMGNSGLNVGLGGRVSKGKDNKTRVSPSLSLGKGPLSVGVSLDDISDFFKSKKKKQESIQESDPYAELDNATKAGKQDMEKFLSQQEKDARKKMKPKDRKKSDAAYDELAKYMEDVDPLVALKKRANEAPETDITGPLTAQPEMNPNNVQTIINRMMPLVKAGLLNDEQLSTFRSAINQFEKGIKPGMEQRKVLADVLGKLLDIITNDLTLANRIKADLGKEIQPEAA